MAFLMDEPLGTLDTEFRDLMVRELRELHDRIDATTVYVTHDQLEAMAMADKIAVMNRGVIEQFGTPQEIYDRPASMFVADFIGSPPMNFLALPRRPATSGPRHVRVNGADIAVPVVGEDRAEGELVLGVRPGAYPLRRRLAAPRHGLRRRISRHHADRHGQHRARSGQGAAPRRRSPSGRARRSASPFAPSALSLFDKPSGRAIRTALDEGAPHG